MKKRYRYTDMHPTQRCKHCGRPIKARLVVIKTHAPEECYLHFTARRCREMGRKFPSRLVATAKKRNISVGA